MTGGWDGLTPGTFYFNCDGVRTPVFDPARDGTYAAVAILPTADTDYDLRLHMPSSGPTHGFASSFATSSWGPGQSEYVLVDFTGARAFQFDAGVTMTSGSGNYTIQNATSTFLTFQQGQSRYGPFTLAQGEILALHEVDMPRGGYYVTAEIGHYPADLGISFHTAGVDFQAKADAQVGAWFAEPDQDEQIYVNEYNTDSQCLVVWKRNTGADIPLVEYYLVFGHAPSDSPGLTRDRFALHAAVPNPFNPQTTIAFDLPASGEVRLAVYDVAGRLVRRLVDGEVRSAGRHEEIWDGRDAGGRTVAAGTYFYRLEAGGFADTRSMTLVK